MTKFRGDAVHPRNDLSADDHAAAYPGAQRKHHRITAASAAAVPVLGNTCHSSVVGHINRKTQFFLQITF